MTRASGAVPEDQLLPRGRSPSRYVTLGVPRGTVASRPVARLRRRKVAFGVAASRRLDDDHRWRLDHDRVVGVERPGQGQDADGCGCRKCGGKPGYPPRVGPDSGGHIAPLFLLGPVEGGSGAPRTVDRGLSASHGVASPSADPAPLLAAGGPRPPRGPPLGFSCHRCSRWLSRYRDSDDTTANNSSCGNFAREALPPGRG